jgi:hypothetical protein
MGARSPFFVSDSSGGFQTMGVPPVISSRFGTRRRDDHHPRGRRLVHGRGCAVGSDPRHGGYPQQLDGISAGYRTQE